MIVSGWELITVVESPVKRRGCMETLNRLSLLVIARSQSRHSSRIKLSPSEMLAISEQLSRDFTPSYSSQLLANKSQIRLSAQEMLSISEEISREFVARPSPQLHQSEIVLLPVDPDHLHAYWHLDEVQKSEELVQPLTLRIYSMPDNQAAADDSPGWFDMPIEPGLSQQKVTVPEAMTSNYYSAAIGWQPNEYHFASLACSETTYIPRIHYAEPALPANSWAVRRALLDNASGRGKLGS